MGRARDRASADLNGQEFILDADADTSITADTDDQVDIKVGGTDTIKIEPDSVTILGPHPDLNLQDSDDNNTGGVYYNDGRITLAADNGAQHDSSSLVLSVDGTARMTVDSGGDIDVETGDIFFSTAGKGINLGVTSNTDSNTLDDYEEGTFDLTAHNANLTLEDSSTYGVGRYVKVGRLVTVMCSARVSSVSSTNAVFFTMPFTAQADPTGGQNESSGSGFFSGVNVGDAGLAWYWAGGSNLVTFYKNNDDAGGAQLLNSDLAANDEMYFTATCIANS
jgi:hypothetical protein